MRSKAFRVLAMLMVIVLLMLDLSACKKKAATVSYKNDVSKTLAERITENQAKLKDTGKAVQEALALGGIPVANGKQLLVKPAQPATTFYVLPVEAANLALDASNPSSGNGLTMQELGKMMSDFGWPFAGGSPPEQQLILFFQEWIRDASNKPKDPASFTPLFLEEMGKHKAVPSDLAAGNEDPKLYRFSLLELQMIAGAFNRILPHDNLWSAADEPNPLFIQSAYASPEPCSDAKDWFGNLVSGDGWSAAIQLGQIKLADGVSASLEAGLKKIGISAESAGEFSKAMTSLGIMSKIWKLVSLYTDGKVAVSLLSDADPMQKPLPSEKEQSTGYKAVAGISDEDWKAYKDHYASSDRVRALRDCFGVVGLPTFPDIGDLAKDIGTWKVEWRLTEGGDNGVIYPNKNEFSDPSYLQMKLKPEDDHSASALFIVDLKPQQSDSRKGPQMKTKMTAEANLVTSQPPSLGTFVNAIKGGFGDLLALSDALVEIAGGWIQDMFQPKAYATQNIVYYGDSGDGVWTGTASYEMTRTETISSSKNSSNTTTDKLEYDITLDQPKTTPNATNASSEKYYSIDGIAKGQYLETYHSLSISTRPGCGVGNPPKETSTTDSVVSGSNGALQVKASLTFSAIQSDGTRHYQISLNLPSFDTIMKTTTHIVIEPEYGSSYCKSPPDRVDEFNQHTGSAGIHEVGVISGNIGVIDGQRTFKDGKADVTVKWHFTRKDTP